MRGTCPRFRHFDRFVSAEAPDLYKGYFLQASTVQRAFPRLLESDGIEQPAHLLAFGPDLLCNAQKNESVPRAARITTHGHSQQPNTSFLYGNPINTSSN